MRLVVKQEVSISERFGKGLLEMKLLYVCNVQRLVEKTVLATASFFGRVHGRIGTTRQLIDTLAIPRADRDTDT